MVEVSIKNTKLRISVWKYIVFLLFAFLLLLFLLWYLIGSQWGANNPILESLRRYLAFANTLRPNVKPEDDFDSVLRIHGIEKLGPKRFAMFVTATDKNGKPSSSITIPQVKLKIKDVKGKSLSPVIDRVRPLHMYSTWKDPISCSMVLDNSGSMFPEDLKAIESYYETLINEIVIPFYASVIKFHDSVDVLLALSDDKSKILKAIQKALPIGNTAMYDGIDKGIETVQGKPHLRFVILTTDGNDNASLNSQLDVLRRSKLHNVSIFVFGFGWLDPGLLKTLSEETDGLYSYVPDSSTLKDWFKKLAIIINNVQVIEFATTTDMNLPKEVDLKVEVNGVTLSRVKQTAP